MKSSTHTIALKANPEDPDKKIRWRSNLQLLIARNYKANYEMCEALCQAKIKANQ